MGVLISRLGHPYSKTTSIKFVPRYVFVNHCTKPVVLVQDNDKSIKQFYLNPGDECRYNFENKGDKDNFVKLREPTIRDSPDGRFLDYPEIEPTDWSSRFSVDNFEDFQLSVKASLDNQIEEIKEESEITQERKLKWHEPSEINEYRRFIRVIITTKDEATLFIMLCDPNMPEYRIHNYSGKNIK
jgi:hypothetical protein